jgi:hypothetical protein
MVLQLTVPLGARLISGQASERIVDANDVVRRTMTLQLDSLPSTDLLVALDIDGPASGAHARGAYRFGRPEAAATMAPRSNPLIINGRSRGQPVPLGPPTPPPPKK